MIRFQVDPDQKFAKAVEEAAKAVGDLRIPLGLIATSFFKSNKAIFSLGGPGQYADLSALYKKQKQKKYGFIYPIFRAKGALEESLTNQSGQGAISKIVGNVSLMVGTSIPYAIFHQSNQPRKRLPFRPVVMIGSEQQAPPELNQRREIWIETMKNYVLQVSRKFGQVPSGSPSGAS